MSEATPTADIGSHSNVLSVLSCLCCLKPWCSFAAGSSGSKSNLGGAASQSWGELASRASNALKGNTGSRQHTPSLASSHTSDHSSSGLGSSSTGSSLGQSTGQHSQSGGQALGAGTGGQAQEEDFLSQRDPTNPSSVVGAHSAWIAEPHTALSQGGWVPGVASDRCLRLCNLVHDYKHNQQR